MQAPLDFRVLAQPLYLMKPAPAAPANPVGEGVNR
jgi:hypothetical protein